jgi:S1-C subfamily serine protease
MLSSILLRVLLLLITVITSTFAAAQCSMCLCRPYNDYLPDGWGGTSDFSACRYRCTRPSSDSSASFSGPGFSIDPGTTIVISVLKMSPAEIAGIRPGDKLTLIDSMPLPVTCRTAFTDDSPHTYTLHRPSGPYQVKLAGVGMEELVARAMSDSHFLAAAAVAPRPVPRLHPYVTGLETEPVLNTWVVDRIVPFSPAARAGLHEGDQIIKVTDTSTGEPMKDRLEANIARR